jgi:hypothetical protein
MIGFGRLLAAVCALLVSVSVSCGGAGDTVSDAPNDGGARTTALVQLKVGDPAPQFSLPGSDGKIYSLASYRGKSAVVLAWFVKAFTGP